MINVTKTYLPPLDEYVKYLERIWDSGWITNNGELVIELEKRLAEYLKVPYVQFVSNGTVALQLALKALEITGEVITTPFSYVATVNSIIWEGCTPVFADIEAQSFCIDVKKIEALITEKTRAIMPVHVYGFPCRVDEIHALAQKYNLKVIYDAAHAFGCEVNGTSLLNYGDLATISFHATKLFHTVEGGAVISHSPEMSEKLSRLRSFGHYNDDYYFVGINAKNTEFHAAMGLCILPKVSDLIKKRRNLFDLYFRLLSDSKLTLPMIDPKLKYNFSYFPVIFRDETILLKAVENLRRFDIIPRRYFYPPLNTIPFINGESCPIAEGISRRILCLPIYDSLDEKQIELISQILVSSQ